MKLENQVCSLELSKKLKELGVKQESLFYWKNYMLTAYSYQKEEFYVTDTTYDQDDSYSDSYLRKRHPDQEIYSAFTVAELGEMLRNIRKQLHDIVIFEHRERIRQLIQRVQLSWENEDEVNDRAKMLIYLLENKLIKL